MLAGYRKRFLAAVFCFVPNVIDVADVATPPPSHTAVAISAHTIIKSAVVVQSRKTERLCTVAAVAAAHWPPAKRDPTGKCLGMVLQFRAHRKAALRLEMQRLQGLKQDLVAGKPEPSPSISEGSSEEKMEGWDPYTHAALMTGTSSNLHVQGSSSSCGGAEAGPAASGTCAMPEEGAVL
jgi:hypothetical protein